MTITARMVVRAAKALQERWPDLGTVTDDGVRHQPSKVDIALVVLEAARELVPDSTLEESNAA